MCLLIVPEIIVSMLNYVMNHVLVDVPENSHVRLRIENDVLRYPIWTPPILKSQITVDRWMDVINRVLQSCETFNLGDGFEVAVDYVEIPNGGCLRDVPTLLRNKLKNKRCIVQIKNQDDLCMARCLVIGRAHADGDKKLYYKLHHDNPRMQTTLAKSLVMKAGLPERRYTLADIPAFEAVSIGKQAPPGCFFQVWCCFGRFCPTTRSPSSALTI